MPFESAETVKEGAHDSTIHPHVINKPIQTELKNKKDFKLNEKSWFG